MKLTLIKPDIAMSGEAPYLDQLPMEPLQLGVLAGLTPPDVDVELFDARVESIPYDTPTDLVAITVETGTARRAYEISKEYRARGVPVVLGGIHPTLIPEEAVLNATSIVTGDAETVWRQVIEDARRGGLEPVYTGRHGPPQPGVMPRRDIFRGKGYLPVTLVQFGRGCKHACAFCSVSIYCNQTHSVRPVNEVIQEIKEQGSKIVLFTDDNIVADPEAAKKLFRALIPLRIHWASQGSIGMARDRELLELMVESGCLGNLIGFESIDSGALRAMKKTPNLVEFNIYEREIEALKEYGLQNWASFVIGLDHDTSESLDKLLAFALKHRFTFATFNMLTPYPKTPVYYKLQEEGRLLYGGKWWLHPEYRFNQPAFKPAHMTVKELTQVSLEMRRKWKSFGQVIKRFFAAITNRNTLNRMGLYWKLVRFNLQETIKKQEDIFTYKATRRHGPGENARCSQDMQSA